MKFFVLTAMLLAIPSARACDLSLVSPVASALKRPVQVKASIAGDILTARYTVTTPTINAKQVLGPKEYPYMFDVVELFLTLSPTGSPYYEFEVSPYNQIFQAKFYAPKKGDNSVDLGLRSTANIRPTSGWDATIQIPLKALGWDGDPKTIRGNFYSVLGPKSERSYWSTFLPKAKKPDFHQPQFFAPLLQCA